MCSTVLVMRDMAQATAPMSKSDGSVAQSLESLPMMTGEQQTTMTMTMTTTSYRMTTRRFGVVWIDGVSRIEMDGYRQTRSSWT
jgi:hypothetical protein